MRRGNRPEFLTNSSGQFLGINLSADYCAEHEWGIKGIQRAFGIDLEASPGIDRRRVTKTPENLELAPLGRDHFLLICQKWYGEKPSFNTAWMKRSELILWGDKEISAAWDEKSFGVLSTKKHREKMEELFDAITNKNAVIGLFGRQVFKNSGLMILIADRIDQEILDLWKESDEDAEKLALASEKTGIKQKIDAANEGNRSTGYYALSPAWIHEADKSKTKHSVKYWLNPKNQKNNQYGWYTVEELEQWLEGRGPVLVMRK